NATITATTANGLKASCEVTVKAKVIEAQGITLDVTEKTLTEGDTFTLTATIDPETTTDKTVTWSSSNTEVATVENGKVTAIAPGTAVITASTANGLTASCTVTVERKIILATSISLDKTSIEAEAGTTVTLTATVLPDDATDKTVAWSSSDESVATVDQEGNVSIIALGYAVITAETTDGSNLYAECSVSGISYVESLVRESGNVDIFSLDGILIRKNADPEYVSNLARGTYIIRTADKTFKIVK
ncbi:MAG: Ig-like domain-containing protein, partial [Muribaculaceae bacterium]|nr:Ig-like domain-containing protein [Muribaculaceae bacterium]